MERRDAFGKTINLRNLDATRIGSISQAPLHGAYNTGRDKLSSARLRARLPPGFSGDYLVLSIYSLFGSRFMSRCSADEGRARSPDYCQRDLIPLLHPPIMRSKTAGLFARLMGCEPRPRPGGFAFQCAVKTAILGDLRGSPEKTQKRFRCPRRPACGPKFFFLLSHARNTKKAKLRKRASAHNFLLTRLHV